MTLNKRLVTYWRIKKKRHIPIRNIAGNFRSSVILEGVWHGSVQLRGSVKAGIAME